MQKETDLKGKIEVICLHMAAYAGLTPPLISEDLSGNHGLRFEQAQVFRGLG